MSTRKLRRKYRPSNPSNAISGKSRIVRRNLSRRREIDHGKTWYICRANIGCERRAALSLKAKAVDVFRPVEDRWRVFKYRCSDVSIGWFGRYLFAGMPQGRGAEVLHTCEGVESVLGVSGKPVAVRPEVLQRIADEIAGYRKTEPAPFKKGQKVTLPTGPFAELEGIIREADEDRGRAIVAVEMFGKRHELELDFFELKAA
jgi:transcription termination/antitermination protein NusG